MSVQNSTYFQVLFLLVFNVLQINLTFAATIDDVLKQEDTLRALERDRQKTLTESIERKPDQLKPSEVIILYSPVTGETPCFNVDKIELTGADANRFQWLLKNLDAFTHTCIGVKSLEILQTNLNTKLLASGYATSRVGLPNQQLSTGKLQFKLYTGHIDGFRLEDNNDLDWLTLPWATWRNAVPIAKGDILNVRDLDQGLEQLKRLPSQDVAIVIEPAEVENSSTLIIKRQQGSRLHGQLSLDNAGSESLGREQAQLGITLDAPLGLSDQLSIYASSNAINATPSNRSQSASVYYSIPFGYHTFSTSFGYSRFGQLVQGTTVQFLSSGFSQNAEAKWHTTVMRDTTSKLGVFGSLSTRRARSYLNDVELLVQQRRTAAAELGLNYAKRWQANSLNIELAYSKGMPWFQAERKFFEDGNSEQPTTRPNIWHGNAELNVPISYFNKSFSYNTRIQWQTTSQIALSIDQFSIGNRYSVRGFDGDIILQSESGYSLRNELRMGGFGVINDQLYLAPYLAMDVGHIWGPSTKGSPFTTLAGAAIGLRAQGKFLSADFALGTPLYKPDNFETHQINPMLQLTLNI